MGSLRAFRGLLGNSLPDFVQTGLVMLLDGADTTTMTRNVNRLDAWSDKLGSGNGIATSSNGTAFNPAYNSSLFGGVGGIRFTGGTNTYLETAAAFTAMSWATGFTALIAGQVTSAGDFFALADASTTAFAGTSIGSRLGVGTAYNAKEGFPLNTNCVFGVLDTGSTAFPLLNGRVLSSVNGTISRGTTTFGKLQVGGLQPGGSKSFDARAILIYNRPLSVSEIQRITRWLNSAYALSLPVSGSAWNIVVDGNSLAVGNLSTGPNWTMDTGIQAATGSPGPLDYVNVAGSGLDTPTLITRAPGLVDPLLDTGVIAKRRICIIWEITNQLIGTGVTDTQTYASIKSYCQARKAAGWKVIVCTCLPRSNAGINVNFESFRTSVNASIRANAIAEVWADAVADIGGDATIGVAGASDNVTNYNADKIHLNSTGHGIAKAYITSAINTVTA